MKRMAFSVILLALQKSRTVTENQISKLHELIKLKDDEQFYDSRV